MANIGFEKIQYHITQQGTKLIGNKCVINRFSNKISEFVFTWDEDNPIPGRKVLMLHNPVLDKYFAQPIVNDTCVIGTGISFYVGRWSALIVGIDETYELDYNTFDLEGLDQTKLTYVSDEFSKIIVRQNFLDREKVYDISYPAVEAALDDFLQLRDTFENESIQAVEHAHDAQNALNEVHIIQASCSDILSRCEVILARCEEIYNELINKQ